MLRMKPAPPPTPRQDILTKCPRRQPSYVSWVILNPVVDNEDQTSYFMALCTAYVPG